MNLTFDRCKIWKNDATLYGDNIAVYPTVHPAYYCLAGYSYVQGQLDSALAQINQAIAVEPDYAYDLHLRSIIYGSMGRTRESLQDADQALLLCPGCAEFYNDRGVTYGNLGRYEEAAADFRKTIELDPSRAQARRDLEKTLAIIKTIKN